MHQELFRIGGYDGLPVNTYGLFVGLGILSALGLFWLLARRTKVDDRVYGFYSILGIVAIAMGLFGAWLFQLIYFVAAGNQFTAERGPFDVGLTFMGGLVLGVTTFVVGAAFFARPMVRREFWRITTIAAPAIAIALSLGRVGCFFAGCCYGVRSDTWGIDFIGTGNRGRVPTNLFEAIFAGILCIVMVTLVLRTKAARFNVLIFAIAYAIWRFLIEFVRDDNRNIRPGAIFSPSQVQSLILAGVGIALLVGLIKFNYVPFLGKVPDGAILGEVTGGDGESAGGETNRPLSDTPSEAQAPQNDFYTEQEKTVPLPQKLTADETFNKYLRYTYLGALGLTGLFVLIGFILALTGNTVEMWFMFAFMWIFGIVAVACMPVPKGQFVEDEVRLDYGYGKSLFRRGIVDRIKNRCKNTGSKK